MTIKPNDWTDPRIKVLWRCAHCLGSGEVMLDKQMASNATTVFITTGEQCPHCQGKGFHEIWMTLEEIDAIDREA